MLILSIDTSGKSGGITLAEGDRDFFRVIGSASIAGGTFSAQLVPTLASVLQKHRFAPSDLGGFVVVSGPGSFTGLRVGLSAVKGLAEVLKKPIATVSLLEALAVSAGQPLSGHQGRVAAVLDAGRAEVYYGVYEAVEACGSRIAEKLLSHQELFQAIRSEGLKQVISSDPDIVLLGASAGIHMQRAERPGSEAVAPIGLQKLLVGKTVGIEELDANYIRRSDAEIFHPVIGSSGRGVTRKPSN
ncbi:MAG TPA: tRNA (adenosine(37)-N6)-threonylcarbamoyltransferase complex dimerization subunit type 1 TsaB [Candidatus Angelobacter sp.]|nr:tRNA (adenosine(37)-N6)-threonylcarbamoyltransferase complex dimerization subunit type 1 TsaB [Candidatus Angelobacter sp.]